MILPGYDSWLEDGSCTEPEDTEPTPEEVEAELAKGCDGCGCTDVEAGELCSHCLQTLEFNT